MSDLDTVRGFPFVECLACGFVYSPAITAGGVARLYASGARGVAEGAPPSGWADTAFLAPALGRIGPGARILDFGAGDSLVPDLLRADGRRVIALDVAPPARPHPDRITGSLGEVDLGEPFDLIYSFQVFEHLPEPRRPLFELLALLKPGGLLLIHTDMETPERLAGFAGWWYVTPPDHCAFYRHRTFERMLAGTGAQIVSREPKSVLIRGDG